MDGCGKRDVEVPVNLDATPSRLPHPSTGYWKTRRFPQPLGNPEAGFPQIHNPDDDDDDRNQDSCPHGGIPMELHTALTFS